MLILKKCITFLIENWNCDPSSLIRSSRPEVLFKKGVLSNFAKITGKHLCQILFNKVAGFRSATLLKKNSGAGVLL